MNNIYQINRGINRPIEFRGLKGQYIWYLGIGLVGLLVVFAALYLIGVGIYFCLGLAMVLGVGLFVMVYRMSKQYGEHGLMKRMAEKSVPAALRGCTAKQMRLVVQGMNL